MYVVQKGILRLGCMSFKTSINSIRLIHTSTLRTWGETWLFGMEAGLFGGEASFPLPPPLDRTLHTDVMISVM